jgi:hypothetical protein
VQGRQPLAARIKGHFVQAGKCHGLWQNAARHLYQRPPPWVAQQCGAPCLCSCFEVVAEAGAFEQGPVGFLQVSLLRRLGRVVALGVAVKATTSIDGSSRKQH